MSHIFISYSTKNGDYARKLAEKLREEGFDVWIDKRRLHSSEDWWRSIVLALRGASVCVVILSPESDASRWVQREITLAEKYEKPMFPLLLEGDLDSPNWELFVRTQVENVIGGELPPAEFYDYLEQYAPRQQRPGVDVTAAPAPTPVLDSEIQAEIAHPPPLEVVEEIRPEPIPALIVHQEIPIVVLPDVWDTPAESIAVPVVHQEDSAPPPDVQDEPAESILAPVRQPHIPWSASAPPKPKRRFLTRLAAALTVIAVLGVIGIGLWILPYRPAPACNLETAGEIAFINHTEGNRIYVTNLDKSNVRLLASIAASSNYAPVWSPDGSQIAFVSHLSNDDISVMNADGSNVRLLTQHSGQDVSPAWSPDGSQIAFVSDRDVGVDLYVMDIDGGNVRPLVQGVEDRGGLSWSPDGSQIAFVAYEASDLEIFVMNADGSNVRRLTQHSGRDVSPAWSPDGSQIAFESSRDGDEAIYVMNADGSNPLKLTPNKNDKSPAWSPDGSQIAFESTRNGNRDIYVMNADGSDVCRLTDGGSNYAPAWRPS